MAEVISPPSKQSESPQVPSNGSKSVVSLGCVASPTTRGYSISIRQKKRESSSRPKMFVGPRPAVFRRVTQSGLSTVFSPDLAVWIVSRSCSTSICVDVMSYHTHRLRPFKTHRRRRRYHHKHRHLPTTPRPHRPKNQKRTNFLNISHQFCLSHYTTN